MKTSLVCIVTLFLFVAGAHGQNINFGEQSEASRFLNNFRRQASSSAIKQDVVRRSSQVANGYGVSSVQPPSDPTGFGSRSITPPRSQSASFGVGTSQPSSKPFAHVNPAPTISPYLGLFDEGFGLYQDLDYQTIVRPAIQQRQFNEQVMRQAQTMNRRLSSLSARNAFNTTGNQQIAPTGHAATFQNLSRFYGQTRSRR